MREPRPRVLIVEDEGIVALDLVRCLRGHGYEVIGPVDSATAAIQWSEQRRPDLVLMDIMLRGERDGIVAADEIRRRLDIPVVFLTAYGDGATVERARKTAPYAYIVKPFTDDELGRTIDVALSLSHLQQEARRSEVRRALESLVGGLASDIRHPLFSLTATLDAFRMQFGEQPEFEPHVVVMEEQTQRLEGLVSLMTAFSAPPRSRQWLDFSQLVRDTVTVCAPEAESLGVRLAADPGRDLRVEGDIGRLSLALRCLLESAIRHSEEGSQIEISARRHTEDGRRWMEYEVAHRGLSSEAMQLDRRFDEEAAPFTPGVGLGLTIVRQVLAEHGGHAEARTLPWGGAQVFLRLPAD